MSPGETDRKRGKDSHPTPAEAMPIFFLHNLHTSRGVPWVLLQEQLGRSDDGLRGSGGGPPTAGGELSGFQALKPPQINIDLTKSLKYESFVLPKLDYF